VTENEAWSAAKAAWLLDVSDSDEDYFTFTKWHQPPDDTVYTGAWVVIKVISRDGGVGINSYGIVTDGWADSEKKTVKWKVERSNIEIPEHYIHAVAAALSSMGLTPEPVGRHQREASDG